MNYDEHTVFYHRKTGKLHTIPDEVFAVTEGDEPVTDLNDYDDKLIKIVDDISKNNNEYIELPDRYQINEYSMIEKFVSILKNDEERQVLEITIKGSGAFRRFKEMIGKLNLEQDWYNFRDLQYKKLAIEWCGIHQIEYSE